MSTFAHLGDQLPAATEAPGLEPPTFGPHVPRIGERFRTLAIAIVPTDSVITYDTTPELAPAANVEPALGLSPLIVETVRKSTGRLRFIIVTPSGKEPHKAAVELPVEFMGSTVNLSLRQLYDPSIRAIETRRGLDTAEAKERLLRTIDEIRRTGFQISGVMELPS